MEVKTLEESNQSSLSSGGITLHIFSLSFQNKISKGERPKASQATVTEASYRNRHGGRSAVAEQPEAENEGGNDEARVANCLLTTKHLSTVLPCPQTNYLHAVDEII